MSYLCNCCELRNNMEEVKIMLNDLIVKKNNELLDENIISLSKELDILVYSCMMCNKQS